MWKWSEHTGVNPDFRVAGIRDRVSEIRVRRAILYPSECPCSRTLWYVVFIGAFLMIAFVDAAHGAYLADPSRWDHRVFPGDHDLPDLRDPLQGAVSVSSDSFQSVYDLVMKWDEPA
jgi:hypothetical protein